MTGVVFVNDFGTEIEVTLGVNTTAAEPLLDTFAADPAKWTARYGGNRFVGASVSKANYDRLWIVLSQTGAEAGPDEISYEVTPASPSDIEDARGRWLAGFEGMPL